MGIPSKHLFYTNDPTTSQPYAWVITVDHCADADAKPGTNMNAVGKVGPRHPMTNDVELIKREGRAFRMLFDEEDPQEALAYEGFMLADWDHPDVTEFEPLEDFGEPNAGCAWIQYKNLDTDEWETL